MSFFMISSGILSHLLPNDSMIWAFCFFILVILVVVNDQFYSLYLMSDVFPQLPELI